MNASLRYVFRNLGRRRLRTAAGALGIFCTIALLVAIQVGLDSISTSYTDLVAIQSSKADFLITSPGGHFFRPQPFDPSAGRAIMATNKAVRGLAPRWIGLVQVRSNGSDQYALLLGVDPRLERELDLWGLDPEPNLRTNTCAISSALAKRLAIQPGNPLALIAGESGQELTLALDRIVERQMILPQEVREFVIVNEPVARHLLAEPERVHHLAGAFHDPSSYYDSRDLHRSVLRLKKTGESMAEALGLNLEVHLPKARALTAFLNLASPLRAIFGVFALLALAVTGLLIYSIVSVAVEERIREYGILRALGGRRRDIFRLVLSESVVLCALGVLPGVLAGTILARLIVVLVELVLKAEAGSVTLAFSSAHLWWTLGAGVLLSIGSALVPALQATRRPIVDALDPLRRGQIQPSPPDEAQRSKPLFVTGLALSLLSVVVFFVLPTAFLSGNSSLIGTVLFCLLLSILLGFTLMAVGALPLLERLVMHPLRWCLGPAAELARSNLDRCRRRNTTTALMFILSVSLVLFLASLVALFSRTAVTMVEHFNGAPIRIESDDPEAVNLKSDLTRIDGIQSVSEVRFLRSRSQGGTAYDVVASDLVNLKHLWIVPFGVDAQLPRVLFTNHIRYAEGGPEALDRLAAYENLARAPASPANDAPPVILSSAVAGFLEVHAGDLVQLSFHLGAERRSRRFKIEAICAPLPGFDNFRARVAAAVGSGLLMPLSSFSELTQAAPPEALLARYFIQTENGADRHRAVARDLRDRFDLRFRFGVRSALERQHEAQLVYWTTQVFFGLLLALAVAISVFALIASMAGGVLERRWEIGMLKALGLRRAQLFRMFLGEALGVTLSAGLAGGGIGFAVAWLFVLEAGALAEIPVVFTLPYVTFLATLAISITAGAVAAHLPTRRLLRKPAAEILRLN